ncbi:3-deoxy-D-manno-octulosonic acid transferase [Capnocytophaga sp. oral taxon 878]|uniref:3-deoxy-D-manno-octulosonic acid transferase n=1 Tax=Capnocytophaga sp. oral taxon 878 TaxID=1316596 RepID=UPI000D025973|nr:glycosyltransferase N-terminal domain-containing protein [Capnocytophaga sp. oral taxon 878]AVM50847.1 3-deoxy-D-manno-octulosonic acid transferase [Capnocytophaga sp. oral taxon 878]
MKLLYTFSVYIIKAVLPLVALFSKKIRLFVNGRKTVWDTLTEKLDKQARYVWLHAASLGEFEQGLPVAKALRAQGYKVLITFFSPSGYEVRKHTPDADIVIYLPLDTPANAHRFVQLVQPVMAIFVKYEFWVHYLAELKKAQVPTYLLSGIFRKNQIFFKPYGGLMRSALRCFTHFFVQNELSAQLLNSLGFTNVTVSGDTRFDRVAEILERDNHLDFVQQFKGNSLCVVFGSSWPADEDIYLQYINTCKENVKFIIAPHNINPVEIAVLKNNKQKLDCSVALFSEKDSLNLADYEVLIIDTIGILTKVYSYADIAYVGGGMGTTGLHNVLEPAVFGIPVIIGKNYDKFNEAKELVALGGVSSVNSKETFAKVMNSLINSEDERNNIGRINQQYIANKQGATKSFLNKVI